MAARQLQQWYRTLDQLLACKAQVEYALFVRLRDLFSLQVDMVFYDLTSTYFEGRGPPEIGAHGWDVQRVKVLPCPPSRRRRAYQVLHQP